MEIHLKDNNAKRVYTQFLSSIESLTFNLRKEDREEVKTELASHLYESMKQADENVPEINKLLDAIEKLGNLNDIIKPIIADKMIEYAQRSLNPQMLLSAYWSNTGKYIRQSIIIIVFSISYMLVTAFSLVAIVKIFNPKVGLYVGEKVFFFGIADGGSNAKEALGYWIIPLAGIAALVLYLCALGILRLINTKH